MSIPFYDASVGSYLQVLDSVGGILGKGASHAADAGLDLQEVVMTRLRDDMMPFHFQVVSVAHHSWGAMQGLQKGELHPPSFELDKDYAGLQALVAEGDELMAQGLGERTADAALARYREALALAPGDAMVRDRLERLEAAYIRHGNGQFGLGQLESVDHPFLGPRMLSRGAF